MKPLYYFVVVLAVILFACSGSEPVLPSDNGPIERVYVPVSDYSVNTTLVSGINALFTQNSIDYSQLRYYGYGYDSCNCNQGTKIIETVVVRADQYLKDVRVFQGDMLYNFQNDTIHYVSGFKFSSTNLTTIPKFTLPQLRKLFSNELLKNNPTFPVIKTAFLPLNLALLT